MASTNSDRPAGSPTNVDSEEKLGTSFYAMTTTQFLGAFNDNLFKQLILLLCVDLKDQTDGQVDYQPYALALFAIPFVFFSGYAGYLSDRHSKRSIIVVAKIAEIIVMLLAMAVFFQGGTLNTLLLMLFVVLFLMSTQSAFFGPSKYGILPELFQRRQLPHVNGIIQMTTFVAIIFGMALAGYVRDWSKTTAAPGEVDPNLWIPFAVCVGIAMVGTASAIAIRKTRVADPKLKFEWSALWANAETRKMLWSDRPLLIVLLASSLFWFVGAIIQPAVNEYGVLHLRIGYGRTSLMAACMGIGIAAGCVIAGRISKRLAGSTIVRLGAIGIVLTLFALIAIGGTQASTATAPLGESLSQMIGSASMVEWLSRIDLVLLGMSAGFFVVPMQVVLQSRPPAHLKGRMIGTMNLVNWIAIVLSAIFLGYVSKTLSSLELPMVWLFAGVAVLMLPLVVFRLPDETNQNSA